jgi:transposase InsO family protein
MSDNGLHAKDGRRRKIRTTIPDETSPPLPDLIGRDFGVGEPGQRSCGDITYIPTDDGWLYLADVLDLESRRVIGFAMESHMRTELVSSAMEMATEAHSGDVSSGNDHRTLPRLDHRNSPAVDRSDGLVWSVDQLSGATPFAC